MGHLIVVKHRFLQASLYRPSQTLGHLYKGKKRTWTHPPNSIFRMLTLYYHSLGQLFLCLTPAQLCCPPVSFTKKFKSIKIYQILNLLFQSTWAISARFGILHHITSSTEFLSFGLGCELTFGHEIILVDFVGIFRNIIIEVGPRVGLGSRLCLILSLNFSRSCWVSLVTWLLALKEALETWLNILESNHFAKLTKFLEIWRGQLEWQLSRWL